MRKTLKDLNLENDFLFAKVMTDKEVCKIILEHILNIEIEKVEILSEQNTIEPLFNSKGVRLDVYVKDEKGTIFNCEMQRGRKKELPKRSRYYQGSIDLNSIRKGEKYTDLSPSYVIFICTFDPFDRNRYYYTFKETCVEDKTLFLGDETTKVFLNTRGKIEDVDNTLKEFLGYVENSTDIYVSHTKSDLVKLLHKRVKEVKESKELEVEFMTLMQRDREKLEEGREEGREEAMSILRLFHKGYSAPQISDKLGLEEDMVKEIIRKFVEN